MHKKKLSLASLFIIVAFLLSGCSLFTSKPEDSEVVYPPGIITPTPKTERPTIIEDEPSEEPTEDASISPTLTPEPSTTISPTPASTENITEGDYRININSAIVTATATGVEVKVDGEYTDNCTLGKYSWELNGNQVVIEIGQPDENVTDCQEATRPYTSVIPLNYSFKAGEQYTILANGFESEPFTIEFDF
ncbi:hypothetical protein KBD45_07370 [Candidatus Dojkabacteria bacterium]|nr:hypothetical protein [Candidatus Dojkabacteria bacterium]